MALIRIGTKLPSGIDGLYIYHHVCGKLYMMLPDTLYTKEDVVVVRDILDRALTQWFDGDISDETFFEISED